MGIPLAALTTIGLGGPAERLVEARSDAEIVEAVARADAAGRPLLVLGGGSNVVVSDAGFAGTVLRVATRGITAEPRGRRVRLAVAAGEPWEGVVAGAVAAGFSGIEALSGIPGTTGATPIQNVGAYGRQVADTIVSVRVYDRRTGRLTELARDRCGFGYRSSVMRGAARYVVLGVTFELERSHRAQPVRHRELACRLGVAPGARPSLVDLREAVLVLRRQKGMVLDHEDPDSASAGSFFLNPLMLPEQFAELARRAATGSAGGGSAGGGSAGGGSAGGGSAGPGSAGGWSAAAAGPPAWPQADGRVKTSAAWLIEHAGFRRGFGEGRVGISTRHALALVNRGGASTGELVTLARRIRSEVDRVFGVMLVAEPTLVGIEL